MVKATKKKKPVKKKKKQRFGSFGEKSLKKIAAVLHKIRHKKVGKKKRKVGLTNTSSYYNLLDNADRERRKKAPRNRMKAHPFRYPSMINDADVNRMWRGTKPRKYTTRQRMLSNMNEVFQNLVGFNLLKPPPAKKLPKDQRGEINIVQRDKDNVAEPPPKLPTKPARAPSPKPIQTLPTKPSRSPPRQQYESGASYSDVDDDGSESDSEKRRRKKRQ